MALDFPTEAAFTALLDASAPSLPTAERGALGRKWWATILDRYHEPQRRYHSFSHIEKMWSDYCEWARSVSQTIRFSPRDESTLLFAVLFHDIVYNPRSSPGDNETQSAALWTEFAEEAHVDSEISKEVHALINATATHHPQTNEVSAVPALFLDLDLAVLGRSRAAYETYAEQIRKEYSHIPTSEFCAARSEILQGFARRDRIYLTEYWDQQLDGIARENIAWEISDLAVKGQ